MLISFFSCLMIRLTPISTLTDTLFPYTPLFRSYLPYCAPNFEVWNQSLFRTSSLSKGRTGSTQFAATVLEKRGAYLVICERVRVRHPMGGTWNLSIFVSVYAPLKLKLSTAIVITTTSHSTHYIVISAALPPFDLSVW